MYLFVLKVANISATQGASSMALPEPRIVIVICLSLIFLGNEEKKANYVLIFYTKTNSVIDS